MCDFTHICCVYGTFIHSFSRRTPNLFNLLIQVFGQLLKLEHGVLRAHIVSLLLIGQVKQFLARLSLIRTNTLNLVAQTLVTLTQLALLLTGLVDSQIQRLLRAHLLVQLVSRLSQLCLHTFVSCLQFIQILLLACYLSLLFVKTLPKFE